MNKTGVNVPSLSKVSSKNASKRFDYVIKKNNKLFGIEVNFYSGGGSKLNETARSYKNIFLETKNLKNFQFV
jgi:type II restriction enzyme